VHQRLLKGGPLHGIVTANSFVNTQTSQKYPLPLLAITADASSPGRAVTLARRAARAFQAFIVDQQNAANIKPGSRVQLLVVNHPKQATLATARKKTLPAVIFLTILSATLGLAFVLENLRPRVHPISTLEDDRDRPRRSA
jgi:hypothetical protein